MSIVHIIKEKHIFENIRKCLLKNPKLSAAVAAAVVVAVAVVAVFFANYKYLSFERAFDKGNLERAVEIYSNEFKSLDDRAYAHNYIIDKLDKRFEDYTAGGVSVDELSGYAKSVNDAFGFPELARYLDYAKDVSNSQNAYAAALLAEETNRMADAIYWYSLVGSGDPDYEAAKEKIDALKVKFKAYVDANLPAWKANNDWRGAVGELYRAEEFFQGEYTDDLAYFSDMQYEYEKKNAMDAQMLCVYGGGQLEAADKTLVFASVKNNSQNTVAEYTVAFCAYDDSKKLELASADKPKKKVGYLICTKTDVNIAPGAVSGEGYGWAVSKDCAKDIDRVEACAVSAKYTNGEVWENPYFDYWCNDNEIVLEG